MPTLWGPPLKDPWPEGVPSWVPRVEESSHTVSPDPPSSPELEEMMPPQDLALVPKSRPPPPPGFSSQDLDDLTMPTLEDVYHARGMTMWGFSALELLEMTISHTPMTGESSTTFRLGVTPGCPYAAHLPGCTWNPTKGWRTLSSCTTPPLQETPVQVWIRADTHSFEGVKFQDWQKPGESINWPKLIM